MQELQYFFKLPRLNGVYKGLSFRRALGLFFVAIFTQDKEFVRFWNTFGSVAEWVKASFLRRPWSKGLGSNRTLVMLLRPRIRRFTMIISAWWLLTSSKFSGQEFEEIHRNIGSSETPKQVRIPPITKYSLKWKVCGSSNKLGSHAVRWQEDKYALQQQQQQLYWICPYETKYRVIKKQNIE